MADMEELDVEGANLDLITRIDTVQLCFAILAVAFELAFHQTAGERRGIDRRLNFIQKVLDGAGVVFMTVGDDDPANAVLFGFDDVCEIGDDIINPDHVILREHQGPRPR